MLQDPRSRLAETRAMMSDAAPGEPMRIGAELRAAREAQGWELSAMAGLLRIRQPYLEALEEGRVAELPGTAYALGFLRSYAAALGLDADEMSRRFRAGAGAVGRRTELAFPAPVPQRGVPAGAVVLLGLLLAGGAYVGWYRYSADGHTPVQTVPAVPDRLATATPGPISAPSPQVASILPSTAPPSPLPALAGGAPAAAAAPSASAVPAVGTAIPAIATPATGRVAAAAPAGTSSAVPVAPAQGTPAPDAAAPPASPDQVALHATANSWVMVRPAHGAALLNKVLHAGDSFVVPVGQKLTLSTGNAAALQITVGGTAVALLSGSSRRDVSLDPDGLRAGKVQAAPPAARPHAAPARPAASADDSADTLNARQLSSTSH